MTLSTGPSGSSDTAFTSSRIVTSVPEGTIPSMPSRFSTMVGSTPGLTQTTVSTESPTDTTSKRCEEMQAIDHVTSKQIVVTPC